MNESQLTERNFRGEIVVDQLGNLKICICGVGALGSNLMMELYRMGAQHITIIDNDRVEEHNISTQVYGRRDIGHEKVYAAKTIALHNTGIFPKTHNVTIDYSNARRLLGKHDLVIDTLDNAESRNLVKEACAYPSNIPCLHLGMDELGLYSEVVWDQEYYVFTEALAALREGADPCDIGTSRVLIMITVSLGCESIMRWLNSEMEEESNFTFTMRDMQVKEWQ